MHAGSTIPNPLNVIQLAAPAAAAPFKALTFTPELMSLADRDWIIRGEVVLELEALHPPAGLS